MRRHARGVAVLSVAAGVLGTGGGLRAGSTCDAGLFVRRAGTGFEVSLPESMAAAIQRRFPGFTFWTLSDYGWGIPETYTVTIRQVPWAAIGDFDGDGCEDLVAEGHTDARELRICVWGGSSREILVLEDEPRDPSNVPRGTVLEYVEPGPHGTNFSYDEIFIWTDAFFSYVWDKAGSIHYWKDGAFRAFYAAD
jgi:hypothetical protein